MWPFLPLSLFPPVLGKALSWPRQAWAEYSVGDQTDLGSQVCLGQGREGWGRVWNEEIWVEPETWVQGWIRKVPGASCP